MSRFSVAKQVALDNLETLIVELLGGNASPRHRQRSGWNVVWPYRARAKASQTIIWLNGARRGGWRDFVSGEGGDVIDLVAAVKSGSVTQQSRLDAVEWLEDRFGLRRLDPATRERMEREAKARREAIEAAEEKRRAGARDRARRFFYSCLPIEGSLAETYLAKARGIELAGVPNLAPALRFHPACEYWLAAPRDATGRKTASGPMLPAMIAAMVDERGRLSACHYTFLRPDGLDKSELAVPAGEDLPKAKMMFPETYGLRIRLTYGPSGLNMERAAAEGVSGLEGVAEGIEDALSAGLAYPGLRAAAAGSLSGFLSLYDHDAVSGWLLFKDNDWDNPQAGATFERAVARQRRFGKPVEVVQMPGSWGKDVNDALRGTP
uniref:DUF7146 domain-containing protein n=1 Tax=Stappia sp. TaxID=1870903 RepID=UPI003BAB7A98